LKVRACRTVERSKRPSIAPGLFISQVRELMLVQDQMGLARFRSLVAEGAGALQGVSSSLDRIVACLTRTEEMDEARDHCISGTPGEGNGGREKVETERNIPRVCGVLHQAMLQDLQIPFSACMTESRSAPIIDVNHQRPGTDPTRQRWPEVRRVMGVPRARCLDAGIGA